ncbi:MAG: hypothetical protein EXX96DRAFT_604516 [Benjaminiella poitrasii]|nr:MAG: hypothetical protein EXX96DRAFT_604516 [Benjaminiella poitrasii]
MDSRSPHSVDTRYEMDQQDISSLDESDQDFSNFVIPNEYTLRNYLIYSLILTDQRIINIITKSLLNAPKNSYIYTTKELSDNCAFNTLYIPLGTQSSLPPILVNISEKLDNLNISQIIQHCSDIFERYNSLPICLIISQQKVNNNIFNRTTQYQEVSFLREI